MVLVVPRESGAHESPTLRRPGHFWSLAIEEQFYLVWPFIIAHVSEQRLLKLCAAGAVAAFVSRTALAMAHVDPECIEYMPFTRMDALLAGAALAVLARRPGGLAAYVPHAMRWGAVAGIVAGVLYFAHQGLGQWHAAFHTLGYTALVVFYASALLLAVQGPLAQPLAHPVLRFFGKYSYGIYVSHITVIVHIEPVLALARRLPRIGGSHILGDLFFSMCALPLIVAVAVVSWHIYERPFLARRPGNPTLTMAGA